MPPFFKNHVACRLHGIFTDGWASTRTPIAPVTCAHAVDMQKWAQTGHLQPKVPILVDGQGLIESATALRKFFLKQNGVNRNEVPMEQLDGIECFVDDGKFGGFTRRGESDAGVGDARTLVFLQRPNQFFNVIRIKPIIIVQEQCVFALCAVQSQIGGAAAV